jgi:hypothetical protein
MEKFIIFPAHCLISKSFEGEKMSVFGHKKVKLTKDELATLLKFLGEDPVKIFNRIEDLREQRPGFSSAIKSGAYSVKPTIKGLEFNVHILYYEWHSEPENSPRKSISQKKVDTIVKVVEFSRGVIHWADTKYA